MSWRTTVQGIPCFCPVVIRDCATSYAAAFKAARALDPYYSISHAKIVYDLFSNSYDDYLDTMTYNILNCKGAVIGKVLCERVKT